MEEGYEVYNKGRRCRPMFKGLPRWRMLVGALPDQLLCHHLDGRNVFLCQAPCIPWLTELPEQNRT